MKHIFLIKEMVLIGMAFLFAASCKSSAGKLQVETNTHKILRYASLAGSSHNTQPWRVEVFANDSIVVYADTSRLLSVVDPKGIELLISVGAFIENLDIAANALGYKTEIVVYNDGLNSSLPAACIKLTKADLALNPESLRELELRTTLRIPFSTNEIKAEDREKLVSMAPGNIVFISSNSPDGRFVAEKELEAFTIQSYQKEAQDELATWIRFSDKDVNTKRDGLTPAGMGIKGIGGFMVRNFMKPEDSKKESFVKAGVEKTKKQVENCGGWMLITTETDEAADWINVGRMYERLNIQCRSLNLGFHPMNQLIEVPAIEQQVNRKLSPNQKIRFVARIGYVDEYPAPVSKRRSVESFAIFR